MNIDFLKEFVELDFDRRLTERNNHLINSQTYYLRQKQAYLTRAAARHEEFIALKMQLQELLDTQNVQMSFCKVKFTYVDQNEIQNTKAKIKNIVLQQKQDMQSFMGYLDHLNANFGDMLEASDSSRTSVRSKSGSKTINKLIKFLDRK